MGLWINTTWNMSRSSCVNSTSPIFLLRTWDNKIFLFIAFITCRTAMTLPRMVTGRQIRDLVQRWQCNLLITWSCIRSPGQLHQRTSDPETSLWRWRTDIGVHLTAVLHYDRFPPGGNMSSQPLVEGEPQLSLGGCIHLPDLLPVHLPGDAKDPRVQLHRLLVNKEQGCTIRLNQLESLMHYLQRRLLRNHPWPALSGSPCWSGPQRWRSPQRWGSQRET